MKALPYFRWYPADAQSDLLYTSMSIAELGLFHALLNLSWTNDGIPADLDLLAGAVHLQRLEFDQLWAKVGKCFHPSENGQILLNRRQEEERAYAGAKSERAGASVRARIERSSNDHRTITERSPRASVFVSEVEVKELPKVREIPKSSPPSDGFDEWWASWSKIRGTNHRIQAEGAFFRRVTAANHAACMECTCSYLDSLDNPAKGYNPENFIEEQCRDEFKARWPRAAPERARKSTTEAMLDRAEEILREEALMYD